VLQLPCEHRDAIVPDDATKRFLARPGVEHIAPLVRHDRLRGAFVYDTGPVWPLARVLELLKRPGAPAPTVAALEMVVVVAKALHETCFRAAEAGMFSHGGLSPWRILLDAEGRPTVIGYGIPQLDVGPGGDGKPSADAYHYCPPERLAGEDEDPRADLNALALIAFHMRQGETLFDGDAERVRVQASRALGRERLHRQREGHLQSEVFQLLDQALGRYPDARYNDGLAMAQAAEDALHSPRITGPTLAEVMAWVADRDPDGPAVPEVKPPTGPPAEAESTDGGRARWEKVNRRRGRRTSTDGPRRRIRAAADHNAMYPHEPLGPRAEAYVVQVDQGSPALRLDPRETLAKSAARLVDLLEFSPVDLTGRIRGWYRIVQGDNAWFGDARTSVLDSALPLELEFVPNLAISVHVRIDGDAAPLTVEVGTAVHAQFLVGELRRQLSLEGTDWRLVVDGQMLGPWQILDDFDLDSGAMLILRPRGGTR